MAEIRIWHSSWFHFGVSRRCFDATVSVSALFYVGKRANHVTAWDEHFLQVCRQWYRVAVDDFLWRELVYCKWNIRRSIPLRPGANSWRSEYRRLVYCTPSIESEVLRLHSDQVLHVTFCHSGSLFATTSKDGFIKVCITIEFIMVNSALECDVYYSPHWATYSFALQARQRFLWSSGVSYVRMSVGPRIAASTSVAVFFYVTWWRHQMPQTRWFSRYLQKFNKKLFE